MPRSATDFRGISRLEKGLRTILYELRRELRVKRQLPATQSGAEASPRAGFLGRFRRDQRPGLLNILHGDDPVDRASAHAR